jgi:tetratricopeptide (TPR) repeat protein
VTHRPTPRNGWTAVPSVPAGAKQGAPVLRRAPSASDSTLSFENLDELRSKHHNDRTQDLSLSDFAPASPAHLERKRRLWPAALACGALLALGGLGWFASSKARVSDLESPAHTLDAAPKSPTEAGGRDPATGSPGAPPLGAAAVANAVASGAAPSAPAAQPDPPADKAASSAASSTPEPSADTAEAAPSSEGAAAKLDARDDAAQARAAGLVEKAQALQKRRKYAPARTRYRDALKVSPDYPPALLGLAQVAIRLRDGKQAVQTAKQLVSAQPEDTSHLVLLGDALKIAGQRKEARDTWRSAAKKGNAEARARLRR